MVVHDGDGEKTGCDPHRIAPHRSFAQSVASRSFCSNTICLSTCRTSTQQRKTLAEGAAFAAAMRSALAARFNTCPPQGDQESLPSEPNHSPLRKQRLTRLHRRERAVTRARQKVACAMTSGVSSHQG